MSLAKKVCEIAVCAGQATLPFYIDEIQHQTKGDGTPVTEADIVANEIILKGLRPLSEQLPIISEEEPLPYYAERRHWPTHWLIDPLDGTRGFINLKGEFTVNIALIDKNQPIIGVIYAPLEDILYWAVEGERAYKLRGNQQIEIISTRKLQDVSNLQIVTGHYQSFINARQLIEKITSNAVLQVNSSLKFGVLAEGTADVYPRFGSTSEWDTAAGQCILEQAGGIVVDLEGRPLRYNVKDSIINSAFVAIGDATHKNEILNIIKSRREK